MTHWLQRIGQSDGDTLVSLIAKLGNNTTAFWAAIGYEGATSLANKLTAARAALIDQITALRMAELDPANLPADIDTLLARLTAARAGYLDELAAANIPADVDTLLARLTALRAGYLDELAAANIPADIDTLLARLTALRAGYLDNINQAGLLSVTAARAGYLDELAAANIPADIDTLLARLTAVRAGYLDELAAANLPADIDTLKGLTYLGDVDSIPIANQFTSADLVGHGDGQFAGTTPFQVFVLRDAAGAGAAPQGEMQAITAYTSATGTFAHGAFTAALTAGDRVLIVHPRVAEVLTLVNRLTAARAGYLDELAAANIPADVDTLLARLTAARAGYLDELAAANIPADIDTLLARLTALRAGYLDNLSAGAVALAATALSTAVWTAARAGYLDELAAANVPADIDTLLARLTAARAGYLDELAAANIPADVDTLLARLTAARAGYLDYLATQETVATYSHPNDVTEDTVFTTAFLGLRTQVLGIWLDMVNHTQTQTIRVKCAIDGINYRTFSTLTWLATDDPGVLVVPFATNQNIRVTVQSSVLEGAARDLPYTLVTRTVE